MDPNVVRETEMLLLQTAAADPNALARLNSLSASEPLFAACAHIFAHGGPSGDQTARELAVMWMKRNILNPVCNRNPNVQTFSMQGLGDANPRLRKAAASIIATAVRSRIWPITVVQTLLQQLQAAQQQNAVAAITGCVLALQYLVEDQTAELEAANLAGPVVTTLSPLLTHADRTLGLAGLICVSEFLEYAFENPAGACAAGMRSIAGGLLQPIGTLLTQPTTSDDMSTLAVRCLYHMFPYDEVIVPSFEGIAQVVVQKLSVPSENVRMEAVEFWRNVLDYPELANRSHAYMRNLLLYFLEGMAYSAAELSAMKGGENDWSVPDKPESVRPRSYRATVTDVGGEENPEEDDSDVVEEWTLRQACALALDCTAYTHGDAILPIVVEVVGQKISSPDWRQQEAGILALGAISRGCLVGMQQYLPNIVPRLLAMGNDDNSHYLIRCICLFTLASYGEWILEAPESQQQDFHNRTIQLFITRMQSPSKRLQEAATGALSQMCFLPTAEQALSPFATPILQCISACLEAYQLKNRYMLLETIAVLCEPLKNSLMDDSNLQILMGPLVKLWDATPDNSPLVFPYFSCLGRACAAIGNAVAPVSGRMFTRALTLASGNLNLRAAARQANQIMPDDSEEYISVSFQLLSGLAEAMGSGMEPLIQHVTAPVFFQVVFAALSDSCVEIQVHGFGLIGELAKGCCGLVQQQLTTVLTLIHSALVAFAHPKVASNAAWALSQIALNHINAAGLESIQPAHVDAFVAALCNIMARPAGGDTDKARGMAALCLGVLMYADPSSASRNAPALVANCGKWLGLVRNLKNTPLKFSSLAGMLPVLSECGAHVFPNFGFLVDLALSVADSPAHREMGQFLAAFKAAQAAGWQQAVAALGPGSKSLTLMYQRFGVR